MDHRSDEIARKIVFSLLLVLLTGGCILLSILIFDYAKRDAVVRLNERQRIHAEQAASGIVWYFRNWTALLSSLARIDAIVDAGPEGVAYMEFFQEAHRDQVLSISRVNENGIILATVPFKSSVGSDISGQAHVRKALAERRPVVSGVFRTVQGFDGIAIHVPVFRNGKFRGTVAAVVNFQGLAKRYLEVIRVGKTGYAWVLSREGTFLYHPNPDFVGKRVGEVAAGAPSFSALSRAMLGKESGAATYEVSAGEEGRQDGGAATRHAVYLPIPLGDTFWSVAVASSEDEVLASLASFRNRLMLIMAGVLAGGVALTTMGAKAWLTVREQARRLEAEKGLRESEKRFSDLLEGVALATLIVSPEGNVTFCNPFLQGLCGTTADEAVGRSWVERFVPEDRRAEQAAEVEAVFRSGETRRFDGEVVGRDDKRRQVAWNACVLRGADGIAGSVALVGVDVTDHRKVEAQLRHSQKMEALGAMAGGVAHDFNNVLTVVMGCASMLKRRVEKGSKLEELAKEIVASAERAAGMTQSLLAFSRKQPSNPAAWDVNIVLSDLEKSLRRLIREDIELRFALHGSPVTTMIDRGQIEQVIVNLVVNARDAMPSGGVLSVATSVSEAGPGAEAVPDGEVRTGRYAVLSVSDTGVGMDAETRRHVFEPFFTTKGPGKGTGLGLSIVYGIVARHDGHITLCSETGGGTTFRIWLPLLPGDAEAACAAPEAEIPRGSGTLLLVEDEEAVRKVVGGLLEDYGYRVFYAEDGAEGLVRFREHRDEIALVVTDLVMPRMNGRAMYDEICRERADVPVLFLSGYPDDLLSGMPGQERRFRFVQKPPKPSALLQAVLDLIGRGNS